MTQKVLRERLKKHGLKEETDPVAGTFRDFYKPRVTSTSSSQKVVAAAVVSS